jgi:hypothetical protein
MLWRPAPATAFMGDEICSGIRRVAPQFIVLARTYMTIYTLSHARRRLPCQHDQISRPQYIGSLISLVPVPPVQSMPWPVRVMHGSVRLVRLRCVGVGQPVRYPSICLHSPCRPLV